ncbi:MAG: KamA family radical SAM protein [Planctomycetota bacterium]
MNGHCNDQDERGWLRRAGGPLAEVAPSDWGDWRWHLRNRFSDIAAVSALLGFSPERAAAAARAARVHPFAVTPYYLDLADPDDPADPILRQCIPEEAEIRDDSGAAEGLRGGEALDPFREQALEVAPGLVRRYPDRALLLITSFCSTFCRHCMRKRAWSEPPRHGTEGSIDKAIDYIATHAEIRDVLISGGDPLEVAPVRLEKLLSALRRIAHLDLIRLGTRVPVTLPMRVDAEVEAVLAKNAPLWVNTHFNHPRELTGAAVQACHRLRRAGALLGNQSVLLRGVNDSTATLLELSRKLLRASVRPYYLHHCDPVAGLGHLRVPLEEGRQLVRSLYGRLSGLGIPRFVVDIPGGHGKVPPDLHFECGRLPDGYVFEGPISGQPTLLVDRDPERGRG